ncbi:hypothetical protein [Simkania sp.]|uniref:hypothetical protein n=1 Tax=Simkania sp. TaxID=34094 RepID=UPI003B52C229
MVHPVSVSKTTKCEAHVFGEVLKSFMKLFEVASRHAMTPGDVKKMAQVSARLRKATYEVIQKTGNASLRELFAEARRSFSQSYGAALARLPVRQY